MITAYSQAVYEALRRVVELLSQFALPLAIAGGAALLASAVFLALRRDDTTLANLEWRRPWRSALGYGLAAVVVLAAWSALGAVRGVARQDIQWRESAQATANPMPEAPQLVQASPVLAALTEHTYTRTLTLPPQLLERVNLEGLGVLSPYLTDPSAENVLKQVDSFRRSGRDMVFSREVTRLTEDPIPFTNSTVRLTLTRLSSRAYDAAFEGRYQFSNPSKEPVTARFLFSLPNAGTLRDLSVAVGGEAVAEPNAGGMYEWKHELAPGESREAVVRYRAPVGHSWQYDLGSQRRRVQQFHLETMAPGPVRFVRGGIQPSSRAGGRLTWDLSNVVTEQRIALAFPPDINARESYLQALSTLPIALLLFVAGLLGVSFGFGPFPGPARSIAAVLLFTLGLAAAPVLANYTGAAVALIVGPLAGALLSTAVLRRVTLLAALPAALVPAAFLSPQHTGILVLGLALLAVATAFTVANGRFRQSSGF